MVFRAINQIDMNNLENNKDIYCSLIKTHEEKSRKSHKIYYDFFINKQRGFALDTIAGHVAGARLRVGLSPWISTSKNFDLVCSEYAIPQSGRYNEQGIRKNIIAIETDNILSRQNEVKELRSNEKKDDIIIDISNGNLNKLYKIAFMSETYNKDMPGYKEQKYKSFKENPEKYNVKGLSNYALYSEEVIIYKQIRKTNVKCIIYPILQDILYGNHFDMENNSDFLIKNINTMYSCINEIIEEPDLKNNSNLFNYLYPSYKEGNNLTDYLFDNYDNIKGKDIYEKYDKIKNDKQRLLEPIAALFTKKFNYNFNLTRVVDDGILVFDLDNPKKLSDKQINDVILVKNNNDLYKYDSKEKNMSLKKN